MGISREGVEILPSAFHLWDIAVEFKGLSKNCFWPPANRRGNWQKLFQPRWVVANQTGLLLIGPTPSGCHRENYQITQRSFEFIFKDW